MTGMSQMFMKASEPMKRAMAADSTAWLRSQPRPNRPEAKKMFSVRPSPKMTKGRAVT